ncbi:hypothetical protein DFQ26_003750 [Actinomortierella ambigua]|nr:hypothetical protein DFQ26_003750 [Actinomortierella ambigua]
MNGIVRVDSHLGLVMPVKKKPATAYSSPIKGHGRPMRPTLGSAPGCAVPGVASNNNNNTNNTNTNNYNSGPNGFTKKQADCLLELEYKDEIFQYMKQMERETMPVPEHMDLQPELTWDLRPLLVDFLIEIHNHFHLQPETLYLAMNMMDRYLSKRVVYKKHYQLVGMTSLWISSKYEDSKEKLPSVSQLCKLCSNTYDEAAFITMERHILKTLDYNLGHPTAEAFLKKDLEFSGTDDTGVRHVAQFLMELSLFQRCFLSFGSSTIASAALFLARNICRKQIVIPTDTNVFSCIQYLDNSLTNVSKTVHEKYARTRLSNASVVVKDWVDAGGRAMIQPISPSECSNPSLWTLSNMLWQPPSPIPTSFPAAAAAAAAVAAASAQGGNGGSGNTPGNGGAPTVAENGGGNQREAGYYSQNAYHGPPQQTQQPQQQQQQQTQQQPHSQAPPTAQVQPSSQHTQSRSSAQVPPPPPPQQQQQPQPSQPSQPSQSTQPSQQPPPPPPHHSHASRQHSHSHSSMGHHPPPAPHHHHAHHQRSVSGISAHHVNYASLPQQPQPAAQHSRVESGMGDSTRRSSRQRHQPTRLINDPAVTTAKKTASGKQQAAPRGKGKAVATTKSRKAVQDDGEESSEDAQSGEDEDEDEDDVDDEDKEDEVEEDSESSSSSSSEEEEEEEEEQDFDDDGDDDGDDSDFEDAMRKPKKTSAKTNNITTKGKGRSGGRPKIDRIPVIRRPKEKASGSSSGQAARGSSSKTGKAKKTSKASRTIGQRDHENEDAGGESAIYDAIVSGQVALDMEATQWCEKYEESPQEALLDLVNLLIRCCGCTQMLTLDELADQDRMVETLEDVLGRYKETTTNFDYPMVSKQKEFKKFKKNLLEFLTRLIRKAQADFLYVENDKGAQNGGGGTFMNTLLTWTISLSSTTFRPFRHTASVVALHVATCLVEMAAELEDDLNTSSRQLAAAQKSKGSSTIKVGQLRKAVNGAQAHKKMTLKWIEDIFVSVFVMRCRDVDPLVRVECVRELGLWMAKHPDQFLSTTYLRYIGWLVTDKASMVRTESLRALSKLYELDQHQHHANTLRPTMTRLMDKLVGLALGDADLNVRLAAIRLLTLADQHGQLETEDQQRVASMIFCTQPKIRKALAKFIQGRVAEDEVAKRIAECEMHVDANANAADPQAGLKKDWIELKSLASFFVKVGQQLAAAAENEQVSKEAARVRMIDEAKTGRIALAVEALWSDMEILKNWKTITEYLLQDHTSGEGNKTVTASTSAITSSSSSSSSTTTSPPNVGLSSLTADYRLEDEEEAVLLEVLVASIQLTLKPPVVFGFQRDKTKMEAQQAEAANEVGRYLVHALPQLFVKYGVDENGIQSVLAIPQLLSLNVYVDLRMMTAYEELVAEVIKVYQKHVHPSVLSNAARTLRKMQEYEMLRASNEVPLQGLCTWVLDQFLITCPGADHHQKRRPLFEKEEEGEASIRNSEEREKLTSPDLLAAVARFEQLVKHLDMTANKSGAIQRETFEGLLRVIELGSSLQLRGNEEEDAVTEMVMSAMSIGFLWISWLCRGLLSRHGAQESKDWTEAEASEMKEMRDGLIRLLQRMVTVRVMSSSGETAQTVDPKIRRKAFQTMGDLYWLFGSDMFHASQGPHRHSLWLRCDESTQEGCEQFVRSELELWEQKLSEHKAKLRRTRNKTTHSLEMDMEVDQDEDEDNEDESSGGEGPSTSSLGKNKMKNKSKSNNNSKKKKRAAANFDEPLSDVEAEDEIERAALLDAEQGKLSGDNKYEMFGTVLSYMRQLMLRDLDMKHAVAVVSQYGRFGGEYDEGVKRVVTAIKQGAMEGQYASDRLRKMEAFMSQVVVESLKESYERVMDNKVRSFQATTAALAKMLVGVITPPGFLKTKRASVAPRLIWEVQRQGIQYVVDKMVGFALIDDEERMAKMTGFFEVLGQLLFGIHAESAEVKKTQELLQSELSDRSIVVREGREWEPLRTYQARLDKLLSKATVDQATAAAAAITTTPATEAEKRDVEMADATEETNANKDGEGSTPPPPSPTMVRKRQLLEVEDEEMEGGGDGELAAATEDAQADKALPDAYSDDESLTNRRLSAIRKETKRLKLDA